MLPTYALEQMICMGVIPREDDDAVRIIRHGMCVQQECVDQLITDIKGKVIFGKAPKDAIAIETAARLIGGRHKP